MPYDQYQLDLMPEPLKEPVGENWATGVGIMKDTIIEAAIAAVKCRWITVCPDDAVDLLGTERGIPRYPSESITSFRNRIHNAWVTWGEAGTNIGMVHIVQGFGYPTVRVHEQPSGNWWEFTVVIDRPHTVVPNWSWGDGTLYGSAQFYGYHNLAIELQNAIKSAINYWKPTHEVLVRVIFVISGYVWGDTSAVWGASTGTWGAKVAYF